MRNWSERHIREIIKNELKKLMNKSSSASNKIVKGDEKNGWSYEYTTSRKSKTI